MDKVDYNYDLKDEDIKYFIMGRILANMTIEFYGKQIKQVSVRDMFKYGEKWFNSILQPYVHNRDVFLDVSGVHSNIGLLEAFNVMSQEQINSGIMKANEKTYNQLLTDSLCYFFDVDISKVNFTCSDIGIVNIVIGDKSDFKDLLFIDSNRFEELRGIILLICGGLKEFCKSDMDKKKDDLNFNLRDGNSNGFKRMLEAEKEDEAKIDKMSRIYNIYNSVVSMISPLDYDKVLKLNISQLYNSYNNTQIREDNQFVLNTASNGMCSEGTKITPFIKRIEK